MGVFTGGAETGADGDPAVAYAALGITDKVSVVGAITAVCGGRGMAGGAAWSHGKAEVLHKGIEGMFIKVLDLVEGLANVEEKPYHSVVGSVHGHPWLMKQGGRTAVGP